MLCYTLGSFPWSSFPNVTVTLSADAHHVFDVVLTPRQYLMLAEENVNEYGVMDYCYRLAVSPSPSGQLLFLF